MDSNPHLSPRLRQLELETGLSDWPIPTTEQRQKIFPRARKEEADSRHEKLGVLNGCHGTFLSERELDVCISLVDYRLGTVTSVGEVLDAFFKCPVFGAERGPLVSRGWSEGEKRELRDALMLVNVRAGMSVLLGELELVVALVAFVYGVEIGVREVLGLRGRGAVEGDLAGALGRLDLRVGERFAVEDLGDVFEGVRL